MVNGPRENRAVNHSADAWSRSMSIRAATARASCPSRSRCAFIVSVDAIRATWSRRTRSSCTVSAATMSPPAVSFSKSAEVALALSKTQHHPCRGGFRHQPDSAVATERRRGVRPRCCEARYASAVPTTGKAARMTSSDRQISAR